MLPQVVLVKKLLNLPLLATTQQSALARKKAAGQSALTLLASMDAAILEPDTISYNAAFSACEKSG